jgi:hypothetical protein
VLVVGNEKGIGCLGNLLECVNGCEAPVDDVKLQERLDWKPRRRWGIRLSRCFKAPRKY